MNSSGQMPELPRPIPVPTDDGAANHLAGMAVPAVSLPSTSGRLVTLARLAGRSVVYCYPGTGQPGRALPAGWDDIPGARGCTLQPCAFRDHHSELARLGAQVFGLSTQPTEYQREVVARLQLPFALLSDARLVLAAALSLPTIAVEAMVLLKRLTLILRDGEIEHVFYPVFPPDKNAAQVLAWLAQHRPAPRDPQAAVADRPAQQNTPEADIRLATPSDAPFLAAVLYEAFAEYELLYTRSAFAATTPSSAQIARRMSEGPIWVAVREGMIVGTVSAAPRGTELYVRSMAVLPDARGHRVGALLLTALESFASTHGYERLFLSTTPFLTRAIRLYERWGFRRSNAGPHDLFGTPLFTLVKDLRS